MKKLFFLVFLLLFPILANAAPSPEELYFLSGGFGPLSLAQGGGFGPLPLYNGVGAPTGSCQFGALYTNNSNGNLYSCNNGTWLLVASGGGGGTITGCTTSGGLLYNNGTSNTGTCSADLTRQGAGSIGQVLANPTAFDARDVTITSLPGFLEADTFNGAGTLASILTTFDSQTTSGQLIFGGGAAGYPLGSLTLLQTGSTYTSKIQTDSDGTGTIALTPGASSAGVQVNGNLKVAGTISTAPSSTAGATICTQGTANGHATANTITTECPASVTAYEHVLPGVSSTGIPHYANAANVLTESISAIVGADMTNATVTATQLAAQYSKGSCTELWGGSGTSFAMTSGDDAIANNSCYNDSGVTRTITAVKCRGDNASNTTVLTPTFGAAGTGTAILTGTVTCGNSYAYSATGTLNNTAWTTGTGIDPGMSTVGNATSIAMIVEYTF